MRNYHVVYFGSNNKGPLVGSMTITEFKEKRLTAAVMNNFRKTIEKAEISNVVVLNCIPLKISSRRKKGDADD
jgi:hypothetical protein